jgi:serine/threonine protein kinase/tetratricopeptide (TPR) repeat protein
MAVPTLDEAAIFNAARRIGDPAARRQYVREACGDDGALAERVEALLRAHDEDATFLAAPAEEVRGLLGTSSAEGPGTQIGPYKLLQALGEGGMGTVFLAEQTEPVRRQVAVKVVKPGMDSGQVLARFEAERQALALMDHPNIAKALDAGTTADNRPYFVMELIGGVPIIEYCDREHLAVRRRLELFVRVCQAVQHAHQKGVIHRDIKPSNVLVALYDGRPVPKVIDFGIAKATGVKLTEQTLVTGLGSVLGTLEYMSPEQSDPGQLDIDTRSDIYSLGVLLYELLTGTTPLRVERLRGMALLDLLRNIREGDTPRPSARLDTTEELSVVAARRDAEPKKLVRLVRGDLDWIVMKCLEKDRSRRYETAAALARDVERHLNEEPVEACPPSRGYRLRKFAHKHRKALGAAAAFVLLLTAATGVSAWLAVRATLAERAADKERAQAVAEKERADEQAAVARAVKDFLQNDLLAQATAFKQGGPDRKPDRDIKVRTLLDRAAANIAGKFEQQPLVEAEIRNTLAITYDLLGEHPQAEVHAARARELFVSVLGPEDIRSVNATNNLANTLKGQGRPDEARKLFEEVLEVSRRVFGRDHPATLGALNNLANTLGDLGRWDEARSLHEEALEARLRVKGAEDPDTLQSMNNLAVTLRNLRKFDDARELQGKTLQLQQSVLGPEHPQTLGSMHNLALLLSLQGKVDEAIKLYEQVLEAQGRVLGPEHPATLNVMFDLAWLYANASDPKPRNAPRAVELSKGLVQHSPRRPDLWYRLGVVTYRNGDWKNAITALEKSLELAPEESVAYNGSFLAMAHWQLGEKETARQWYSKAAGHLAKNPTNDRGLLRSQVEASQLLGLAAKPTPDKKDGK